MKRKENAVKRKWSPVLTAALLLLAFWGWRTWDGHFTPEGREVRPLLVYRAGGRPWAMFPEYLFVYLEDGRVTEARLVAD